ncbi:MAG: efflux transporter outer membrane subunit [Pseudomonadota bacterium]|nr:efflux transporter outer membrane subunit [Pseudomonadota bacterium]
MIRYLIFLLLLAGCHPFAPAPVQRPALPETFPSGSGERMVEDEWWKDFNSSALNGLMDEALASAPAIRIALARLDQAEAAAAKAGSALWPQSDLNAEAARSWTRADDRSATARQYGLGLAASYELDLWGRVSALRQAGTLVFEAGLEDARISAMTLAGELAEAWINLCSVRKQIGILHQQQKTNAEILSILEIRFTSSLASALDIFQQREAMAQIEAGIPPLLAEAVRLENRINLLAGKLPGTPVPPAGELPSPLSLPEAGLPADLLDNRPDIRASRLRLEEAGWNLAAVKADRLPALRLTGRFSHEAAEVEQIFDNWAANIAAALTAPLLDGGRRAAEVRRQDAVRRERLADYENTVLTALAETDSGLSAVRKQQEHLAALDIQMDLSAKALQNARWRYQNGLLPYNTVLDQRLRLQQLERTRVQQQAALLIMQAGLCRSLGKGWRTHFSSPQTGTTP